MKLDLPSLPEPFSEQVRSLYDEAIKHLPAGLSGPAETAWMVREVIAILERNRGHSRSLQALLGAWAYNTQVWQFDEEEPREFREYLQSIGRDHDGTKLSESTISDMVATAEIILPYCEHAGIDAGSMLRSNWGKFREAIPTLRRAIERETDPEPIVSAILADVQALPNRESIRQKYRKSTTAKTVTGDSTSINGKIVVALVVDPEDWPTLKNQLSRKTEWAVFLSSKGSTVTVHLPVSKYEPDSAANP